MRFVLLVLLCLTFSGSHPTPLLFASFPLSHGVYSSVYIFLFFLFGNRLARLIVSRYHCIESQKRKPLVRPTLP